MQDLKTKQLETYKGMITKYLKRGSDDAWVKKSYDNLTAVGRFLKATGVMSEQEEEAIIAEAREEAGV